MCAGSPARFDKQVGSRGVGPFHVQLDERREHGGSRQLGVVVHQRSHGGGSINRLEVTGDGLRSLPRVRNATER